jgi:hypothetical protein
MTRAQFWAGAATLYAIGLAAALTIMARGQKMPADAAGALAIVTVPLVWGMGPIVLALCWLAAKRDLRAARFGLLVFAALYLVIVGIRLWWGELI